MNSVNLASSFRDPAGFVFEEDGVFYRQVNDCYKKDYDKLMGSGLFKTLTRSNLLLNHTEVAHNSESSTSRNYYKHLLPDQVPFISYPFEWCFSQLKDAALLTLNIQRKAIEFGMSLKDASAYNVQFVKGAPVFIDTLSFEKYKEGNPWVAYKQFCEHFVTPLTLMAHCDLRMNELLQTNIDGIRLDLASNLLPMSTWLDVHILVHVHLHASLLNKNSTSKAEAENKPQKKVSRMGLLGLIDNLEALIKKLKPKNQNSFWTKYYQDTNYSTKAFQSKRSTIESLLDLVQPQKVLDVGANSGEFSRLASSRGIKTVSTDMDVNAIEASYLRAKEEKDEFIQPLRIDLSVPSPAIGWGNSERDSFSTRASSDLVMALALVHHLAISNNLPLSYIADYFSKLGKTLIIEFVPKSDSQIQEMLSRREDIFSNYTQESFEQEFLRFYEIRKKIEIEDSQRTIYLMQIKEEN